MPILSALAGLIVILLVYIMSRSTRLNSMRRLLAGPQPTPDREPVAWRVIRAHPGNHTSLVGTYDTLEQAQVEAQMARNAFPNPGIQVQVRPVYFV